MPPISETILIPFVSSMIFVSCFEGRTRLMLSISCFRDGDPRLPNGFVAFVCSVPSPWMLQLENFLRDDWRFDFLREVLT